MKVDLFQQHYTPSMLDYSKNLLKKIHALPKHKHNYGLIHSDLHLGNFNVCIENVRLLSRI